jgi:hypothetical protein
MSSPLRSRISYSGTSVVNSCQLPRAGSATSPIGACNVRVVRTALLLLRRRGGTL